MKENRKAYKVAYLIGVSPDVMEREFTQHYQESNKSKYFKNYKDADVLRALNRARQNIVRYNHLYQDGRTIREITNAPMKKDLDLLKKVGLDVDLYYCEYGARNYINILTKAIDERIDGALADLEISNTSLIKTFFTFPIFKTDKEFEAYIDEQYGLARPHGIIIYNSERAMNAVPYIFNTNFNLYATASTLKSHRVDMDLGTLHKSDFEWRTKKQEGMEDVELDMEKILKGLRLYKNTEVLITNELPEGLLKAKEGKLEIFADTRSIDIYKLISYLQIAGKETSLRKATIYCGKETKQEILGLIPHIIPELEIKVVEEEWSTKKDNKREVIMVADIVKARYENKTEKVIIFSESRDIEGLIRVLPEMEYVIGMEGTCLDTKYKQYLDKQGIEVVDFSRIDGSNVIAAYREVTFKYILGQTLAEMPLVEWDILTVSERMKTKETLKTLKYTETELVDKVEEELEKVRIEVTGKEKYVILGEERIEIK